jgi:hypothetical protein
MKQGSSSPGSAPLRRSLAGASWLPKYRIQPLSVPIPTIASTVKALRLHTRSDWRDASVVPARRRGEERSATTAIVPACPAEEP